MANLKLVDRLLIEKAMNKARVNFDHWNLMRYGRMIKKDLTEGERNDLNMYLFGVRYQEATVQELVAMP